MPSLSFRYFGNSRNLEALLICSAHAFTGSNPTPQTDWIA
jgi:hypothetical protein